MSFVCERCRWFYDDHDHFEGSDYAVCEKCGRLLPSIDRVDDILSKMQIEPRIVMLGDDPILISDLKKAVYDPRYIVTTGTGMEYRSSQGGGDLILSEEGDVAEEYVFIKPKTDDTSVYSVITEIMPTVTIVVLDCMSDADISNYVGFIKKYACLMDMISIYNRPLVVVLSNVDNIAFPYVKDPYKYPEEKVTAINELVERYRIIFNENGARVDEIIPVSSYVKWGVKNNKKTAITAEDVEILVDGRYNIDKLRTVIESSGYRKRSREA